MWVIFSWLELELQVKVGRVASFVGKIFVVRTSTTKTTNILHHENYQLYIRYIALLSTVADIIISRVYIFADMPFNRKVFADLIFVE